MKLKTISNAAATLAIAAWLAFSPLQEARAQTKADSALASSLAKTDSVKTPPKPKLLQPINFASYNRLSPNTFLISKTQVMGYTKSSLSDLSENQSIAVLFINAGDFDASLHCVIKSNSAVTTITDGVALRYALNSGSLLAATRIGVVTDKDNKSGKTTASPIIDMTATVMRPLGLPAMLTIGAGTTDDYLALSTGSSSWMLSALYKKNNKKGGSVAAGADYQITHSPGFVQRFYASLEQWANTNEKDILIGSRIFLSWGTIEVNYEKDISKPALNKDNVALRLSYYLP